MDGEHSSVVHKGEADQVCSVGLYFRIDHLMKQEYNLDADYVVTVDLVMDCTKEDCSDFVDDQYMLDLYFGWVAFGPVVTVQPVFLEE